MSAPRKDAADTPARPHGMWPELSLDERARMDFVKSTRRFMTGEMMPINRLVYDNRVRPQIEKATGAPPQDKTTVRQHMRKDPFFAFYASARRSGQELMWQYAINAMSRLDPVMRKSSQEIAPAGGSLRLNPDMPLPAYATAIDIHCMPGGYSDDWAGAAEYLSGALYDVGTDAYTMGHLGPLKDMFGQTSCAYIKSEFPDLKPRRILDMGCAIGTSTLPFASGYPHAEVHGIDISAPMLRYGHRRAESLGVPVHFAQQNAECTDFDASSFDLILSHIMFHETSGRAIRNILAESHRLLAPGGVMVHIDMLSYQANNMDLFDQFMFDNETYYNNEPFWMNFRGLDQIQLATEAGFAPGAVRIDAFDNALARQVQNTGSGKPGGSPAAASAKGPPRTGFQLLIATKD